MITDKEIKTLVGRKVFVEIASQSCSYFINLEGVVEEAGSSAIRLDTVKNPIPIVGSKAA